MKGQLDRTKVVLRHLPPSITHEMLMDQIKPFIEGRYSWVTFRQGKTSQKHPTHSRAYINFNRPEDVIEFAQFFDGHVFVNEKGAQYKTVVEYAPSQRIPKQWSKRDGREGSILKDPEYMEFLEFLAKPVDNLPSAEVQLERREAERSAAAKDIPVVTPLMDFVRQKRASKCATRRSTSNGKLSRRAGKLSSDGSPSLPKRNSERRRTSSTMYVMRDSARNSGNRDRASYVLLPKRDDQLHSDKSVAPSSASGAVVLEENSGASEIADLGKKKVLLLKGKEREILHMKNAATPKQNHCQEGTGKIVRSILVNREARRGPAFQSDNQTQNSHLDREKRPPRVPNVHVAQKDTNGITDDKFSFNDPHGFISEKSERRPRNKDRPDRGVWAPLRRSDGSHASDESLSSASSSVKSLLDYEGNSEVRILSNRRTSQSSLENGFHKPIGRRGQSLAGKDIDGQSPMSTEGKTSKRGGAPGYGSYEKQVWVQKSSSGT